MRTLTLIISIFCIANCAPHSDERSSDFSTTHKAILDKVSGHWSVGSAYSWFTITGTNKRYWLDEDELPIDIRNRMRSQSSHPTYSDGPEASLHLVVDGYIASKSPASGLEQFHIQRVISTSAPKIDFVKRRNDPIKKEAQQ